MLAIERHGKNVRALVVSEILHKEDAKCGIKNDSVLFHEWSGQNFSLYNTISNKQSKDEIKENINKWIISWSNTKFSDLTS